jgi:hypothetical protein
MTAQLTRDRTSRDTVSVSTHTRTVHVVHVDAADLLGQFDVTDEVVLMVGTPSGRSKRIAIGGNFLAPSRNDDGWAV